MTTGSASSLPAEPINPHRSAEYTAGSPRPGWLLPTTLILLWAYAVYRLGTLWYSNQDYSFGWFVPVLCLALFWERWKSRPAPDASRPASGTFLLLGSFGLALLPAALFLEVIPNWRFAGWIFAGPIVGITFIGFYFWGGRSWSRHFIFPVLFFLVAVPWPTRFEQPLIDKLSRLNAATSATTANLLGTPAVRRGTLIETGSGLVGVDEACSGIRSLQASVMVALFLGELFRYSFFRRLFLLFGGVALAFACNVVRTTYLVRTCDLHGLAGLNLRHDEAGFTILGVTLVGLLLLAWVLRPRKSRRYRGDPPAGERPAARDPHFPSQPLQSEKGNSTATPLARGSGYVATVLFGLAIWIVMVELGIELWFRPGETQATAQVAWSFKLPVQSLEFSETAIPDATRAMLSYDEGRTAQWRDASGRPWQLYYLRWVPARNRYRATEAASQAKGHAPDVCLRNAGMILQTNLGTHMVELNGVRLRVGTERFSDRGRTFHVASCYWEPHESGLDNGSQGPPSTSQAIRMAMHAFKNRDRGRFEKRVLKLGVWDMETDEAAEAAFRERLQATIAR